MTSGSFELRQILLVIVLVSVLELPLRWIHHHHNQGMERKMRLPRRGEPSSSSASSTVAEALLEFVPQSPRKSDRKPKRVPVVGIFSQPYRDSDHEYRIPPNHTVIAASYVKWLEAGGATSIVIPYDSPRQQVRDILDRVDGILFPGGDSELPPAAQQVWDQLYKPKQDDAEASFAKPLWGTCLGFEWIVQLASGNNSILESDFEASNVSLPLEDVEKLELYMPPIIHEIVTKLPVTMNNHHKGISPQVFRETPPLAEHWQVSSTNHDLSFFDGSPAALPSSPAPRSSSNTMLMAQEDGDGKDTSDVGDSHGKQFVSTIEPKDPANFPVYGVQWHPEKNAFEYATTTTTNTSTDRFPYEDIDHSPEGIALTHHMSSFFVKVLHKHMESRRRTKSLRNTRRFVDPAAAAYPSIYSYPSQLGKKFEQIFIIPPSNE